MRLCIVQPAIGKVSETFIAAHAEGLPADVTVVHCSLKRGRVPKIGDQAILSQSLLSRMQRRLYRRLTRRPANWEITAGFLAAFRRNRVSAVLAEYGPMGLMVMDACRLAGLPMIVHFHGYDASRQDVLQQHADDYRRMFDQAAAVIAVSQAMKSRLSALGAPSDKLFYNPYGVDCRRFAAADPASAAPVFLAVGRFAEKKAPHLTLLAFAEVQRVCPDARLRMIGKGPLLDACRDLANGLGIEKAVAFLGAQEHEVVQEEMRKARAFVQHSLEAHNGDSEGTPVAVLEAGASGLPVVSTRHAGIPDVVIEEVTGLLVEERDVQGMTTEMLRLARDPGLAAKLGRSAREHIRHHFSMDRRINRLWSIIDGAARGKLPETDTGGEFVESRMAPV